MVRRLFVSLASLFCLASILLVTFVLYDSPISRPLFPTPSWARPKPANTDNGAAEKVAPNQGLQHVATAHPSTQSPEAQSSQADAKLETPSASPSRVSSVAPSQSPSAAPSATPVKNKPFGPLATDGSIQVYLTETGGSHDEVSAAFIHAFGTVGKVQLQSFLLLQRYGIKEIVQDFNLSSPLPPAKDPGKFRPALLERTPHILIFTTCELDTEKYHEELDQLLEEGHTYLFCVFHHAEKWSGPKYSNWLKPWVEARKISFVALSPHTGHFMEMNSLSAWDLPVNPAILSLTPIFPVKLLEEPDSTRAHTDLDFALQGDYDPKRRDYATIFKHLSQFLSRGDDDNSGGGAGSESEGEDENANKSELKLHLLGHGPHPDVPSTLTSNVAFDERLNYTAFYSILSRTFALLPAFADDDYLDRKASSSVPAALIAGTPIVATKDILNAYSYMRSKWVWFQKQGETDMEVVGRVLSMTREERLEKMKVVREARDQIISDNTKKVTKWVNSALGAIKT
ncbi:hypothetical protein K402DRAFT_388317 [Aulographum hederae CBS 113979]|uniref:Glycosyltransferase family 1 protein n=1 Tax=Aulographum hederae CBS 113979 TaxID=1176131 RepID=A0A6G1HFE6_9PEZI|nr:hypothetical protein K402DRAFT_388317 [Aulographum hederae CBS 113979]